MDNPAVSQAILLLVSGIVLVPVVLLVLLLIDGFFEGLTRKFKNSE